ncbi:glutactin-like [Teleopsis dalmanni]|uniref:glutactin-like n=1 Tax=Teleopsis dalmanni TaxID=139649 RepID=UPI0018CFAEF1|nr:glutactin-like [Teleopsis dalmanni]
MPPVPIEGVDLDILREAIEVLSTTHIANYLNFIQMTAAYIVNKLPQAFASKFYRTKGLQNGRSKASVPESTNNDVIDATREPANCPQFPDLRLITQAEQRRENVDDCLTLNIYTPNKAGQFPVIVFVHGEMLFDGSAAEGQPDYFLEHDVVLVTINYRLAPFGFLTTLTDDMPGNVALADIHMALEWVNQYIRPFGGNADQVTLIGQAGGATLVHALSLSDKALGLFHKLILQSGTALNPYFWDEDPLNTLKSFARLASCPLFAYADDIDITERSKRNVTAVIAAIEKESAKMDFAENEGKTKYMSSTGSLTPT